MQQYERTISEKLIYEGNFISLINTEVELPNGKMCNRDIIKHPGAAAIIAFSDDGKIILVKQFRKSCERSLLEIPAGKLNSKEDPKVCAIRELKEETGYTANNISYLGTIVVAPGFCDELVHIYKGTNLTKGEKELDEDEFTEVLFFTVDEIKSMIRNGEIVDSKTISSMMYL